MIVFCRYLPYTVYVYIYICIYIHTHTHPYEDDDALKHIFQIGFEHTQAEKCHPTADAVGKGGRGKQPAGCHQTWLGGPRATHIKCQLDITL